MKAKIGFVLFIFVFLVMAILVPLVERTARFFRGALQLISIMSERTVRGIRLMTKKISMAEWKNFTQKA